MTIFKVKNLIFLILIFFLGTFSAIAQINVFDQDYYSVIKNKTMKFSQVENMVYITGCEALDKCDAKPNTELIIERDSLVGDSPISSETEVSEKAKLY